MTEPHPDIAKDHNSFRAEGCDLEQFMEELKQVDASDAEKRMVLQELWTTIEGVIRLTFGLDPISQLDIAKRADAARSMVQSSTNTPTDISNQTSAAAE